MKKWLIWCLTVLAMVCLIPGIALNAKAESLYCRYCDKFTDCEILGYEKFDSSFHTLHIKCKSCSKENDIIDARYSEHTDDGKTPTCTTGKTCALCGAEYGVLGHDWDRWTPIYDGTHTHTRRCKRCNAEETGSCSGGYADCTSLGMCNICGGSYYGGHAWGAWTSDGDGTHGTHTRRCTRCDKEETESCSGGATCTSPGVCATCGGSYYGDHKWINPANSSLGNGTHRIICLRCGLNGTASCTGGTATCTTKAVCEVCKVEYGEKNPNNHALEHRAAKAPTCTKPGWNAYEGCTRRGCGYTTYRAIPALKHDLVQHKAKAPTCTEKGWNAYETCSRCDYTTYTELPAQHDLKQHAAKAPTCTEIGWDAYETCSRCDYTTYTELTALNHALVNHDAKAPTCTEKGWDAYETCSRLGCDYTTYVELPAQHDLEQHAAQAPTCTEKGWDAYDTCSRCDHTTYAELPALNHDLVHHDAKAPTCTEIGWNAYDTCSRCNYTTYAELSALNHDYQAVTVEPTCETDGYTVFTCSRCKDSYTADPTDKLGHQFGAWSPNGTGSQSADCLRQGCVHTGSTDCRKFTFRTAEGETLTFCPVCGQAENAAQLEKIDAATAWTISGSLSAADVTARTNGEYLSVAFETAGSLTQPTGRVRLALPAGLLEGKKLVRIAPDGTQTELPFEAKNGKLIFTLDFANSELPVMLFRLLPQTAAL